LDLLQHPIYLLSKPMKPLFEFITRSIHQTLPILLQNHEKFSLMNSSGYFAQKLSLAHQCHVASLANRTKLLHLRIHAAMVADDVVEVRITVVVDEASAKIRTGTIRTTGMMKISPAISAEERDIAPMFAHPRSVPIRNPRTITRTLLKRTPLRVHLSPRTLASQPEVQQRLRLELSRSMKPGVQSLLTKLSPHAMIQSSRSMTLVLLIT
jgi:hypothetical protein